MSNLSDLLPSGAGGKTAKFVASGTLPNGQSVILNSNGTITAVAGTSTSFPQAIPKGSLAVYSASATYVSLCAFDPTTEGRLLIIYKDSSASNYLTAVIGTVSGSSISFGTVTQLSNTSGFAEVSFDPNTSGKFIVAYQKSGSPYGIILRVGTVSGTSISFGAEVTATTFETTACSISYDPNTANKFILAVSSSNEFGGSVGTAMIGTVSGTSISLASSANFNGHTTTPVVRYNPATANQVILSYVDNANSQYGTSVIGTVSGNSISYATEYVYSSSSALGTRMDASKTGIFVVAFGDSGKSIIGTISGTAISYGSVANFISASTQNIQVAFDPVTTNRFVVSYRDSQNSNYLTARVGTVSGSTISYATKAALVNSEGVGTGLSFDPNASGMFASVFGQASNSFHGKAVISQLAATVTGTNLTATNFIGMPDKAYASGATATVSLEGGVSANQTSLTIGSTYYVQSNGTLATSAATPSVEAGRAMSATSILIKGNK